LKNDFWSSYLVSQGLVFSDTHKAGLHVLLGHEENAKGMIKEKGGHLLFYSLSLPFFNPREPFMNRINVILSF